MLTTNNPITLGTTSLTFTKLVTSLSAGNGISISGNQISVAHDGEGLTFSGSNLALELDGSTLSKSASGVKVADGGITNTQVNASAAIAYSKLNLTGNIVNADIASAAAIARSKLAAGTADHVLINDGSGNFSSEAQLALTRGGTAASTASGARTNLQVRSMAADWASGDGTTKAVTHSFGTKDIQVEVYDKTDDSTILVDSVVRTSTSVVTLTASSAPPAAGYRILIKECI
jgi:hypothetical protein